MIVKTLLFIIVLIFIYETYQTISKLQNYNKYDNFDTNQFKQDDKRDITKTIAINCKNYNKSLHNIPNISLYPSTIVTSGSAFNLGLGSITPINMLAKVKTLDTISSEEISQEDDTIEYARSNPLEYNPQRKFYWKRDTLIKEGYRRSKDDLIEINKLQSQYDVEINPIKKEKLQHILQLYNWRNNILLSKDSKTGVKRSMRDIITDYYPNEIGMVRPWLEPHSHIRDYTNELNNGYKI